MTPKLRLSERDKNVSLSWILKFFLPENRRTMISTQITDAPRTHAAQISVSIRPGLGVHSSGHGRTYSAQAGHDPTALIARKTHFAEADRRMRVGSAARNMSSWFLLSMFEGVGVKISKECRALVTPQPHEPRRVDNL